MLECSACLSNRNLFFTTVVLWHGNVVTTMNDTSPGLGKIYNDNCYNVTQYHSFIACVDNTVLYLVSRSDFISLMQGSLSQDVYFWSPVPCQFSLASASLKLNFQIVVRMLHIQNEEDHRSGSNKFKKPSRAMKEKESRTHFTLWYVFQVQTVRS